MNVLNRTPPKPDHRIAYGGGQSQFGELWLPDPSEDRKRPVVVFFHGGWWSFDYDLSYASFLCEALKRDGIAVWSVEYRRVGEAGGGWPGTFQDAAAGYNFVTKLAERFHLDLNRVTPAGHSAGGHLAFWIAGGHHIPGTTEISEPRITVPVKNVIALAGAVDLRLTIDLSGYWTYAGDKRRVERLMGGLPKEVPDRYRAGNPGDLLPLSTKQYLLQGSEDDQIPPNLPRRWAENARRQGDEVIINMLPGADHFDLVDPESKYWPETRYVFHEACFG